MKKKKKYLLKAKTCAHFCDMNKSEWLELDAARLVPSPRYIFGKKRWLWVDFKFWLDHECPGRGDSSLMPA